MGGQSSCSTQVSTVIMQYDAALTTPQPGKKAATESCWPSVDLQALYLFIQLPSYQQQAAIRL